MPGEPETASGKLRVEKEELNTHKYTCDFNNCKCPGSKEPRNVDDTYKNAIYQYFPATRPKTPIFVTNGRMVGRHLHVRSLG